MHPTAWINLIFGMYTLIGSDCTIGYTIFTFEVIKDHFRSNNFLGVVLHEAINEGSL